MADLMGFISLGDGWDIGIMPVGELNTGWRGEYGPELDMLRPDIHVWAAALEITGMEITTPLAVLADRVEDMQGKPEYLEAMDLLGSAEPLADRVRALADGLREQGETV